MVSWLDILLRGSVPTGDLHCQCILSIFSASVHQFYANLLVFVNINPFFYTNDQFALQNVHNGAKDFMKVDALNNLGNNLAKSKIHISILKCSSIRFPLHSIIVISFTFFMIFFSFVRKKQRLSVNVLSCILILEHVSLITRYYFLNC